MKLFGQLVRTAVNVALLPVAVAKDIVTLGGIVTGENSGHSDETAIARQIERLKREAGER